MKIAVTDNETGDIIYQYEADGHPSDPTNIRESGVDYRKFRKKMDTWFNSLSEFTQYFVARHHGDGFYLTCTIAKNVVRTLNTSERWNHYACVIEDVEPYVRPEHVKLSSRIMEDAGL